MRVCIVAEGCYPFVVGGVSSWVHSLIQLFPETEFVILAIAANRSQRGKYAYELPKNVSAVYELYLDDVDWSGSKKLHRKRLKKEQYQAAQKLYDAQKYQEAYNGFKALGQYSDSLSKASQSYALMISDAMQGGDYEKALTLLKASDIDQLQIDDKDTLILQCQYGQILDKMNQNDFEGARALIASLTDQNVAAEVTTECDYKQGSIF